MKKILLLLPLLGGIPAAHGQVIDRTTDVLMMANELTAIKSYVGVTSILSVRHIDKWVCPYFDEEAAYLNAIAQGALRSPEGETKLLDFIERYPHSAYRPYAQMRLGEWYFVQGNYRSAAYWFKQYDPFLLPDEMAQASDYYLSFSLMRDGREEQALGHFRPLIGTKTFGRDATFYSGYILSRLGRTDEAVALLDDVSHDGEYGAYACAYMASGLLAKGRYSEAMEKVRVGERQDIRDTEVRLSLLRSGGLAASALSQREVAISYLQDYMRLAPKAGRLEMITLGKELFDAGRYEESVESLAKASEERHPDFMGQLALYYEGLGQLALNHPMKAHIAFDRAAELDVYPRLTETARFNAALALYSNNPGKMNEGTDRLADYLVHYPQGEYAAQAVDHLKDAYLNDPDVDKALASIERITPLPAPLRRTLEKVRLRSANTQLDKGNTSSASRQYDNIIRNNADPASVAEAHLWKGEVAYREGRYGDAIASTQSYLKVRPQDTPVNPNAYYNLGYAYYNLSRWREAEESFREFLRVRPDATADEQTVIYSRLADIEVFGRNYSRALSLYDTAIQKGGNEADYAYFKRGMTYGYLKEYRTKADYLALLSSKYPSSKYVPEALYEQGRALSLLNDERSAQGVFQRVFEQYPNTDIAPKAGVQLALSYFNMQKLDEAARIYEMVARKYPKTDEAKAAMEDLKGISIELNRVDEYAALAREIGLGSAVSASEMDSLAYLAAEKIVGEGKASRSIEALDKYVAAHPDGVFVKKALYTKALVHYQNKAYREATLTLEQLLPDLVGDAELERDAYKVLTAAYVDWGRPDKAAELYLAQALKTKSLTDRSVFVSKAVDNALASSSEDFILSMADDIARDRISINEKVKSRVYGEALHILARSNRKQEALIYADRILMLGDHGQHARAGVVKALELYDRGQNTQARNAAQKVIDMGTTDTYWLARAFVLLADTYIKEGDKVSAKTYLEGVKSNYNNKTDGIINMINERLSKIQN
ncbi:tetratricopeptide repeat protein [Porphyromonas cangingivalis]|uniref:Tetratricopeptide repeat-containing protein n=1 Tax=Porphyromonas cangingivalis TaxID=36874 RepID=A0A1T4JQY3_PORCN|nr:tetratricopeptide repeat protein [Porphyromonas cangingivalis]SJZ32580.1 Tetratricopeptide repeat-containing protein [Porphyromonas cangingivalis]VEJ04640.1 tol-pal system protein YbgF [Porphyromonas cangingivalis]